MEREWEEELNNMLLNFSLTEGAADKWRWRGSANRNYSIRVAYKEIIRSCPNLGHSRRLKVNFKKITKSFAPFKS